MSTSCETNLERSLHVSEYMSELFRHLLASFTLTLPPPPCPIPRPCVHPALQTECERAVHHLLEAFLQPGAVTEAIFMLVSDAAIVK